jgi:hypothetical protein
MANLLGAVVRGRARMGALGFADLTRHRRLNAAMAGRFKAGPIKAGPLGTARSEGDKKRWRSQG